MCGRRRLFGKQGVGWGHAGVCLQLAAEPLTAALLHGQVCHASSPPMCTLPGSCMPAPTSPC